MIQSLMWFLALLMFYSSLAKLRAPGVFWSSLSKYPWGKSVFRNRRIALAVPIFEMAAAVALVMPYPVVRFFGCVALIFFLAAVSTAITLRYRRGEGSFACGCSGALDEDSPAVLLITRNAVLLLLGAVVLIFVKGIEQQALPSFALGLMLLLAWQMFESAILQEGRILRWRGLG